MNISLPVCFIPDEMGWLLKTHFHNNRKSYAQILDKINQSAFLRTYIPKLFDHFMKNDNFESMLNGLGWSGFRDRMACMYLYKYEKEVFPDTLENLEVNKIKEFEDQFRAYFPQGCSRVFMLGFYFQLCDIYLSKEHDFINSSLLDIDPIVFKILKKGSQKSIQADWLILSLIVLTRIMDTVVLEDIIKKNHGNFYKIIEQLNTEQKEILIKNLLAYGASIQEDEIFIDDKV